MSIARRRRARARSSRKADSCTTGSSARTAMEPFPARNTAGGASSPPSIALLAACSQLKVVSQIPAVPESCRQLSFPAGRVQGRWDGLSRLRCEAQLPDSTRGATTTRSRSTPPACPKRSRSSPVGKGNQTTRSSFAIPSAGRTSSGTSTSRPAFSAIMPLAVSGSA